MIRGLHAEWTKFRTLPSTPWLALALVAATIAVSAAVTAAADVRHCPTASTCLEDLPKLSLTGARVGQVAVIVLAILVVSNEYGTGLILTTLTATPRRSVVLLSKLIVVITATVASATLGVLGAVLVARNILPGKGFNATNGYPSLSLSDGPTLRAAAGTVLYLALIAILSTAIGTIVRDTAAALTTAVAVLFVSPVASSLITNPVWQQRLQRYSPMNAGLAIQSTQDIAHIPIGPWAGLAVLASWAAVAAAAAALALHVRDAA